MEEAVRNVCAGGRWAARSHRRQLRRLAADASPVSPEERAEIYAIAKTEEYRDGIRRFQARKTAADGAVGR